MQSISGLENMANEMLVMSMVRDYEKDMQEIARVSHMLKESRPVRPAWSCPLMLYVGNKMISLGKRINAHYSVDPILRTR
jgi:hypothetical protein